MPARKRKQPRGVVDTSVLVAGIAGLKPAEIASQNSSAGMLRDWIENGTFIWLVTDEIILEYKTVLARLGVRRSTIGRVMNLLSEEAELIPVSSGTSISPDPGDDPFCLCSEQGTADFLVTLNPRDFPQQLLAAHVIAPGEKIPTTRRRNRFRKKQR
ncbi:MAG TPA: PIN domain-containing protein [Candidatus Angelobacter sp.]|nr:PIN domain-containing protein [Candidatus Angelobacter sp.]